VGVELPYITESARRHDVSDEDIHHAWRNRITSTELDDGFVMWVGPDWAGKFIEIGVVNDTAIVHAYRPARPNFLR
jgi:hypothetical protein